MEKKDDNKLYRIVSRYRAEIMVWRKGSSLITVCESSKGENRELDRSEKIFGSSLADHIVSILSLSLDMNLPLPSLFVF